MVSTIKFVFFIMIGRAVSRTLAFDNLNEATIQRLETLTLEISSNPSTGYIWTANNPNSDRFLISNLKGTYLRGENIPGAPGKQLFEVSCSEQCQEGDFIELSFFLQRSWEAAPINTKELTLRVVS